MEHGIHGNGNSYKLWNRPFLKALCPVGAMSLGSNKSIVEAIRKRNRLYKDSRRAKVASHMRMYTRAESCHNNIKKCQVELLKEFSVASSGDLWKAIGHLNERPTLHDPWSKWNVTSTPAEKASAVNAFLQLVLTSLFHHCPVRNYHIYILWTVLLSYFVLRRKCLRCCLTWHQRLVGLTAFRFDPQMHCIQYWTHRHKAFVWHLIQCHIVL